MHTAFQPVLEFSFDGNASRVILLVSNPDLSPFPLRLAFPGSLRGRNSPKYYGDSVTLSVSAFRPSRILTYSTYLARFRCPFTSFNGIISHRFPERAFHWSRKPQCISHPYSTGVYSGNVATGVIYNDGRGFRRW
jgi:hypothetical protein